MSAPSLAASVLASARTFVEWADIRLMAAPHLLGQVYALLGCGDDAVALAASEYLRRVALKRMPPQPKLALLGEIRMVQVCAGLPMGPAAREGAAGGEESGRGGGSTPGAAAAASGAVAARVALAPFAPPSPSLLYSDERLAGQLSLLSALTSELLDAAGKLASQGSSREAAEAAEGAVHDLLPGVLARLEASFACSPSSLFCHPSLGRLALG